MKSDLTEFLLMTDQSDQVLLEKCWEMWWKVPRTGIEEAISSRGSVTN